jgi:hypothetical protein
MLREMRWWREMRRFRTHHLHLFGSAIKARRSVFSFPITSEGPQSQKERLAPQILAAFFPLAKTVRGMVRQVTGSLDGGLADYRKFHSAIEAYLERAVVPSSIKVSGERICPPPTAILNAAFKFYLESMDRLMAKIEDRSISSVQDRADLTPKLELWTMKAMEDFHLLKSSESK